jgi:hypothetical protein
MLPFKKLFKNDIMMFNGKRLVVCDLHPTRLGRVERMERGVLDGQLIFCILIFWSKISLKHCLINNLSILSILSKAETH